MSTAVDLVIAAERRGVEPTIVTTPGATIIVIPSASATSTDDLVPLDEAKTIARCSVRTLREGIAAGELTAYGRQRSRAVRRGDLAAWIESRRVRPTAGADDTDIARRMRRLEVEAAE